MKILIASSIDPDTVEELSRGHEVVCAFGADEATLAEAIVGAQVLVFRSGVEISSTVLAAASDLELIIRAGSGYDNIDLDVLSTMKVHFVRIPGPGAKAVSELAFALMLGLARDIRWADREWRAGNWVKSQAKGRLLTGRTLGVVGAGNIGSRTGALGAAWGMNVLGCVERPRPAEVNGLAGVGIRLCSFDQVLGESDFLCVHVPLQPSTAGLIDAGAIAKMKPGSFLINLARGGVVDETALRAALVSGHLAGAALDVHESEGNGRISPLADLENVILTPHIGASTIDSQAQIGTLISRCIRDISTKPPAGPATPDTFVIFDEETP